MSTPPFPPYGAPPPPVERRRPSAWWFVLSVLLMVGGAAVGTVVLVVTIKNFAETDATIAADGRAHAVSVETDGERMTWIRDLERADCSIVDTGTGEEVSYTGSPDATFEKSSGGHDWLGDRTFDPGSGVLEVTCAETGGPIQIGPAPELGAFFSGIALGIIVPFLLGGCGFLLLIILVILYATGRPRRS